MSVSHRGLVNRSIFTFPNISLTKKEFQIYLLFGKLLKNGYNHLYLLKKIYYRSSKSNSYLISISIRGLVNVSTPTFSNINLTKTTTNLLLLGNSIKVESNNLYLQPKPFEITLKSSSYLTSVSRCDPVILSTPTFLNINLTLAMANLLVP